MNILHMEYIYIYTYILFMCFLQIFRHHEDLIDTNMNAQNPTTVSL